MSPTFAGDNFCYSRWSDAVFVREFLLGSRFLRVLATYLNYLGFREFGGVVRATVFVAILTDHIRHVLSVRTQVQVCRIYACRIVARMTTEHAIGDRAIMQFVTKAMREYLFTANAEISMPKTYMSARPFPTATHGILFNLFPKSIIGGAPPGVSNSKASRLPLDYAVFFAGAFSDGCWSTAATFAEFYGHVLRGIIEGHSDLLSRCVKSQAGSTALGQLVAYLHYTPFRPFTQAIGGCA